MLSLAIFPACDCEEPRLSGGDAGGAPACNLDTECEDIEAYRFGGCRPSGCESDADCCPGTRCRLDFNACTPVQLDNEFDCDVDADCPDPAQRCKEVVLGDRDPILACAYDSCEGDLDCGFGRSCYERVCVVTAPCGGSCPDGEACDVTTSQCSPVPADSLGCDEVCNGLRVLRDPKAMTGDQCCALQCSCRGLPPIVPSNFGKYARIAAVGTELLVSAYDGQFGDLVVAHYDNNGQITTVEYVDGIPLGGDVVADPDGPRGGIAAAGPNVGTHTSIASTPDGRPVVAYHDADGRALRFAIKNGENWATHVVDTAGAEGRVGTFTDIAVSQDGTIFIRYLAEDVTGAPGIGGLASGAKVARSRNANPSSSADWELIFADARPAFDPCDGACGAGESCVTGPSCASDATGCDGCGGGQACVLQNGQPTCAGSAVPPSVSEYPRARGLYTSILVDGADAVVALYDSIDGDLRVATVPAAAAATAVVIDGDGLDGGRGTDTGRYPAIAKVGVDFLIVYEDFTRHEVRAWQGANLGTGGNFTVVDRGKAVGQPGKRFVGASMAIANNNGAAPFVVYQDASTLDLKTAREGAGTWTVGTLLEDGAHGFYSDVVINGQTAFIVSVLASLDPRGIELARLGVTSVDF